MTKLKKNQLENFEHLIYLMHRSGLLESEKTTIDYLDWFRVCPGLHDKKMKGI